MNKEKIIKLMFFEIKENLLKLNNCVLELEGQIDDINNIKKDVSSTKEIIYKCGHKSEPVILDSNELSVASYLEWKDSVGFEGDKSQCWNCYCRSSTEEICECGHPNFTHSDGNWNGTHYCLDAGCPCKEFTSSTLNEINSQKSKVISQENVICSNVGKVRNSLNGDKEKTDKTSDIHSQNKELMDKDYDEVYRRGMKVGYKIAEEDRKLFVKDKLNEQVKE